MRNSISTQSDPCFFRVNTNDNLYNVSFEITYRCNLECKHCFNKSDEKSYVGLDKDNLLKLIDELAQSHVKNIYMTGGEPTKYPYFTDAVNAFNKHGIEVILATNGYNIRNHIELIKKNISKEAGVYISIDGLADVHNKLRGKTDAFEHAIDSIKYLISQGVPVRVSTIIWDSNYNQLEELILYLKTLGVSQINFTIPVQIGRAGINHIALHKDYNDVIEKVSTLQNKYVSREFRIFLKRQAILDNSSLPCQGGQKIMHINSNGEIYPCSWVSKAGISEYSLKWEPGKMNECISKIQSFYEIISKREKIYGYSGCPAMAKIYNEDVFAPDPLNNLIHK